jgi:hypothetical protein
VCMEFDKKGGYLMISKWRSNIDWR